MKFSKFFELKKELKRGSRFQKALVLIVVLVALPFTLYEVFQSAKYLSKALINPVSLSFLPSSVSLPPDGTLRLMMDAKTYKIGFVKVEIDFDNSKVNLASEVIPTTTLKKVISLTSLANANATGKIVAILGIDPNDVANAPTGAFELANFKITPVTTGLSQGPATFSISNSNIQIVDMTPTDLSFTTSNALVSMSSPSPFPIPTATATAIPTPTPAASPTVTPTIVPTIIPTCTPAVCATPAPNCVYQGTNSCSCGVLICATEVSSPTPTISGTPVPTGAPTSTPTVTPTLAGDINGDGKVNLLDYIVLFENFGKTSNFDTRADINKDGKVNLLDYIVLFENFGKTAQ